MSGRRRRAGGGPTLDEVAALAGVGRGTVSRVINGSPQVSPAARAAVEQAIRQLGYVPNRAARALVTRRTDAVALVMSESRERMFGEPFFAGIVRGVSAGLRGTPLQLWLMMAQQRLVNHGPGMVIADVRFENEAAFVRKLGGLIIHVSRPSSKEVEAHVSENGVELLPTDAKLSNTGTLEELQQSVRDLLRVYD